MLVAAARGIVAPSFELVVHIAGGVGLLVLIGGALLARTFKRRPDGETRRAPVPTLPRLDPRAVLLMALLLFGALGSSAALWSAAPLVRRYDAEQYYANLTATNARQAGDTLFPAGTRVTASVGAQVRSPRYCGAAGCHVREYRQWLGSAHQRADSNSVYVRSASLFAQQRGVTARRWCEGCHGPLALAAGAMPDLSALSGSLPGARIETLRREGVDCLTCHSARRETNLTGNGHLELALPADYPFAESADRRLRWIHGFLIRLRPGPHRRAYMQPDLQTESEFCASCHRMSYNLPQNGYKFLRTEDQYGSWQAGPSSGQSIHDFSPPGPARRCQDCHDPHRGGLGRPAQSAESASPPGTPESLTPNVSPVKVDLLALRRETRPGSAPEDLVAPLDRAGEFLRPGETVTVDVVVRNRGSGHEFPAAVGSGQEYWLDLEITDGAGRVLLHSGVPGRQGDIECGAHTYGMVGLDRAGRKLEHGDFWNMLTPLYHRPILPGQPDLDRRTIQPGASDVVRYRFQVPRSSTGMIELHARLNCRQPQDTRVGPAVPAGHDTRDGIAWRNFLVGEDSVRLSLLGGGRKRPLSSFQGSERAPFLKSASPVPVEAGLPGRFYDYGVGLLLQGDLPRAQRAMRQVQSWVPKDVRGYLGLGRVYLTEGDLLAAQAQFEQARRLAPNDPRPHAFLATTHRRIGQYDRALAELQPLLRDYPRDRELWFDQGMCYYLTGRFEQAAQAFQAILAIDPDDLAAHYNLMRCLRPLHRVPEARHEEVIYQALREDDSAKQLILAYLRRHPLADRESRTVHDHDLSSAASTQR